MKNKWPYPVVWNIYDRILSNVVSGVIAIIVYNLLTKYLTK